MLGEIESNMKKTFRIKCFKLVLGVSLCFLIYLLVSLIIPPLIGTHEKSDTQAEVSITTSERVCLIDNNEDALLWRLRLIRSAQEEIILSTFDFRADSSGTDVIAALWGAAERGVQVRLIIDGINAQLHLSGSDVFQALAAHDNVEVKFYNPSLIENMVCLQCKHFPRFCGNLLASALFKMKFLNQANACHISHIHFINVVLILTCCI